MVPDWHATTGPGKKSVALFHGTSMARQSGTSMASQCSAIIKIFKIFCGSILAARVIPEYYNVRISISKCGYLNLATMVDFHLKLV